MIAGTFDRRITFQLPPTDQEDIYGTVTGDWTTFAANVPAQVQDKLPSKAETVQNGLSLSANASRIRLHYMPGITSAMRVIVHGETERTCEIVGGPAELGRREGLELLVVEYSTNP